MSMITKHVLDTRLHEVADLEAEGDDGRPAELAVSVHLYADAVRTAPKLVLLGHLFGLVWDTLRGPGGARG